MFVDLASLPLGTLRKAQRVLAQASAFEPSDDDSEEGDGEDEPEEESEPDQFTSRADPKGKGKEKEEGPKSIKAKIPKRSNKHAYVSFFSSALCKNQLCFHFDRPMEVTSKRPVPRKRLVSEEKKLVRLF